MKNILKILIPLILLCGFLYYFRDILRVRITPIVEVVITKLDIGSVPCEEPILYTLGTFDTKFGISQQYFLSALSEAEMIWEEPQGKPFGKELFVYSDDGTMDNLLKINLVHDFRQEATSKLANLGIVVKNDRVSYDSLKAKFTALKTELEKAKNDYDARVQSFNAEQRAYEAQAKYWNAQGGAPSEEYEKLQREKSVLDMKFFEVKSMETQVNKMVDEINAMVFVLNRLADTLNISVDEYNTVNDARGESFEEGVYSSDGVNSEIDIYEFSSREKLVRVLAHELGHALGLGHVDDPKAIMYELNEGNNMVLTNADLGALKTKCGVE